MANLSRYKVSIVFVVVIVVVIVALARSSVNLKKSRKSFRDEMALRLDLEESIAKLEKARAVLGAELKSLRGELSKDMNEILRLKEELAKETNEKIRLRKELEKASLPVAGKVDAPEAEDKI